MAPFAFVLRMRALPERLRECRRRRHTSLFRSTRRRSSASRSMRAPWWEGRPRGLGAGSSGNTRALGVEPGSPLGKVLVIDKILDVARHGAHGALPTTLPLG